MVTPLRVAPHCTAAPLRDRELTQSPGFDHHIVKPVGVDALESLLARTSGIQARMGVCAERLIVFSRNRRRSGSSPP